jgi:hypothetical protein
VRERIAATTFMTILFALSLILSSSQIFLMNARAQDMSSSPINSVRPQLSNYSSSDLQQKHPQLFLPNKTIAQRGATSTTSARVAAATTNTSAGSVGHLAGIPGKVKYLGNIDMRTIQIPAAVSARNATVVPFLTPEGPADFAAEKKRAELGLDKSNVKIFSHPLPNSSIIRPTSPGANDPPCCNPGVLSYGRASNGLAETQSGLFFPPDVQIGVGPTNIVQFVNNEGEYFTKQAFPVTMANNPFPLSVFFMSGADRLSDPRIVFDSGSGHWFATMLDLTDKSVHLAVSTTSDPTLSWDVYESFFTDCPDQPVLGISADKVAISANDFTNCNPSSFLGEQHYFFSKKDLIQRVFPPAEQVSSEDPSAFSLHPVQSKPATTRTTTLFMVTACFAFPGLRPPDFPCFGTSPFHNTMVLESFDGVPPGVVLSKSQALPIAASTIPPNGVQPGTRANPTVVIATGDTRIQDAVLYFDGITGHNKIFAVFNDGCLPDGVNSVSCIRLVQIDVNTGTILQDYDIGDKFLFRFYPAVQVDNGNNLLLVYGFSSSAQFPYIDVLGQIPFAPFPSLFTIPSQSNLAPPNANDRSSQNCALAPCPPNPLGPPRYGDYFGAAVDPTSPDRVWVAGEYQTSGEQFNPTDWSTLLSEISVTPIMPINTTLVLNPIGGLGVTIPTGGIINATGKLIDTQAKIGIGGKTISFDGTGAGSIRSVITNLDGTFLSKGKAASIVANGLKVQAHFAGDGEFAASNSPVRAYNTR